jgi:hypothetical protein
VVAALLERDDDEQLWESVMGDVETVADSGDDIVL